MRETTLNALAKVCSDLEGVAAQVREDESAAKSTDDHVTVIKHYYHVKTAAERIKAARDAIAQMEEALSRVVIPDMAIRVREATGLKPPYRIEGVGTVSVAYRFSCSMIDKNLGLDYLRKIGQGGIIQETVNSSTLSAFGRSWMEDEGKELPEDIFKTSMSPYTSIRK